jgi:hypothetical protein
VRGVQGPRRDDVSRVGGGNSLSKKPRIRVDLCERPGDFGTYDRNVRQIKSFADFQSQPRLVDGEPVHGEEGVDMTTCGGTYRVRRLVDQFFGARWVSQCPQHVAGPQESEPGVVLLTHLTGVDFGEYRFGLLTTAQPRECMRSDETRFGFGTGADGRVGESVGQRQVGEPDSPARRLH